MAVHQQGNKDTCVFSSFACALHHSGRVKEAAKLQHEASKPVMIGLADTELGNLREYARRNIKELRVWRLRSDEREQFAMDLDEFDKSAIYSVIIDATDSHQSHCVAIYDGWIFDSNEKMALPLCRASLDSRSKIQRFSLWVQILFAETNERYEESCSKGRKERRSTED